MRSSPASAPTPPRTAPSSTRTTTPTARRCPTAWSGSGSARTTSTRARVDGARDDDAWRPTTCSARSLHAEVAAGGEALILTGDRDMYQCVGDGVQVLFVKTGQGRGAEPVDADEVRKRYGVGPELVPDFIALRGDPSDGLPGAKGIGREDRGRAAARLRLARGRDRGGAEGHGAAAPAGGRGAARPGRRAARVPGHREAAHGRRDAAAGCAAAGRARPRPPPASSG